MKRIGAVCVLTFLLAGWVTAGELALSVSGSGLPGTPLTFTVKGDKEPNRVVFLGISPALGKTEFPFVTLDLAMPIWASGMGSLNKGTVSHRIVVPAAWPPNLTITLYAQAVVVTPKGTGHQAVTTNVVKFLIRGK